MHSHLGVLGVTGFLMKDLSANPLDYVEGGAFNRRRRRALGHPRWDQPRSLGVSEARRQDDRHDRHQRHARLAGRAARLLPVGARQDGPRHRRSLRALLRDAADRPRPERHELRRRRRRARLSCRLPIPNRYDQLGLLFDWVENNTAPGMSVTVTAGERSLPLCSYPTYPRYRKGEPTSASAYECAAAESR